MILDLSEEPYVETSVSVAVSKDSGVSAVVVAKSCFCWNHFTQSVRSVVVKRNIYVVYVCIHIVNIMYMFKCQGQD